MKLIVAVVRDDRASALTEALTRAGFGATRLPSTGGFLRTGSTTFLAAVASAQVENCLELIRETCPPRAEQSGATVFVVELEKMIKV